MNDQVKERRRVGQYRPALVVHSVCIPVKENLYELGLSEKEAIYTWDPMIALYGYIYRAL